MVIRCRCRFAVQLRLIRFTIRCTRCSLLLRCCTAAAYTTLRCCYLHVSRYVVPALGAPICLLPAFTFCRVCDRVSPLPSLSVAFVAIGPLGAISLPAFWHAPQIGAAARSFCVPAFTVCCVTLRDFLLRTPHRCVALRFVYVTFAFGAVCLPFYRYQVLPISFCCPLRIRSRVLLPFCRCRYRFYARIRHLARYAFAWHTHTAHDLRFLRCRSHVYVYLVGCRFADQISYAHGAFTDLTHYHRSTGLRLHLLPQPLTDLYVSLTRAPRCLHARLPFVYSTHAAIRRCSCRCVYAVDFTALLPHARVRFTARVSPRATVSPTLPYRAFAVSIVARRIYTRRCGT